MWLVCLAVECIYRIGYDGMGWDEMRVVNGEW